MKPKCIKCNQGTYSLNNNSLENNISQCTLCELNSYCPGGDKLIPKNDFWKLSDKSTLIIQCPLRTCENYQTLYSNGNFKIEPVDESQVPKEVRDQYYSQIRKNKRSYDDNGRVRTLVRHEFGKKKHLRVKRNRKLN